MKVNYRSVKKARKAGTHPRYQRVIEKGDRKSWRRAQRARKKAMVALIAMGGAFQVAGVNATPRPKEMSRQEWTQHKAQRIIDIATQVATSLGNALSGINNEPWKK